MGPSVRVVRLSVRRHRSTDRGVFFEFFSIFGARDKTALRYYRAIRARRDDELLYRFHRPCGASSCCRCKRDEELHCCAIDDFVLVRRSISIPIAYTCTRFGLRLYYCAHRFSTVRRRRYPCSSTWNGDKYSEQLSLGFGFRNLIILSYYLTPAPSNSSIPSATESRVRYTKEKYETKYKDKYKIWTRNKPSQSVYCTRESRMCSVYFFHSIEWEQHIIIL